MATLLLYREQRELGPLQMRPRRLAWEELGHRHRGAVFADLNGDDWLDLLVSHSGCVGSGLFINQRGVFQRNDPGLPVWPECMRP